MIDDDNGWIDRCFQVKMGYGVVGIRGLISFCLHVLYLRLVVSLSR